MSSNTQVHYHRILLPALVLLLSVWQSGCDLPDLRGPGFTQRADTVFAAYRELYGAESITIAWTVPLSDTTAGELEINVRNSRLFTLKRPDELGSSSRNFAADIAAELTNPDEFSTITINFLWEYGLLERKASVSYSLARRSNPAVEGSTSATTSSGEQPATSATATQFGRQ